MEYLKTIGFYAHLQAVEIMTGETRIEVYVRHRPTKYLVFPRRPGRSGPSCMQPACLATVVLDRQYWNTLIPSPTARKRPGARRQR